MAISPEFSRYLSDDDGLQRIRRVNELDNRIRRLVDAREEVSTDDANGTTQQVRTLDDSFIPPPPPPPDDDRFPQDTPDLVIDNGNGNGGDGDGNGNSQPPSEPKVLFKQFDPSDDVISVQRVSEEELFFPNKAVNHPYTSSDGYIIESSSAETGFESYFNQVFYLDKTNSEVTYLSTMRALSGSYDTSSGSGMSYRYMINLTQSDPKASKYTINDSINAETTTDELDIVTVAREFYKDGLDPDFFGMALHYSGSTATSPDVSPLYEAGDNLVGLFAGQEELTSKLGSKYYLYPYESGTFYDESTDTLTVPDRNTLLTGKGAMGEIYADVGIVVLFIDKIEAEYTALTRGSHTYDYLALLGGNSRVNLTSTIFYARLENFEFNYTSNPTFYEEDNPNVIKAEFRNDPRTFPTIIGYYNRKNELIAIGKISAPFEKNSQEEAQIRAEISY